MGSGSAVSATVDAATAPAPPTADDVCETPCRLLKDQSIDAVKAKCPDWALGTGETNCEDLDLARNCIYATYGYTFKKDRYKKAFGDLAWYKPDPAFKDSAMSKQSTDNVAQLKQMAEACRTGGDAKVSAPARKVVEAWFAARKKGKPPMPAKVSDLDGQPITGDEFIKRYIKDNDQDLFDKDPWEELHAEGKDGDVELVGCSTGVPNPKTCTSGDEDCEGFEFIVFGVKAGAIVSIDTGAAACPFVYERAGDAWAYRGEILRNLASPAWEATQTLALGEPATCGATRTIRIAEEKAERTYLDSVALAIDGAVITPDACGAGAVCADDGRYAELATGDSIELTFTLPAPSCARGEVIANGYYVRATP